MGLNGRLTRDGLGISVPPLSPLYAPTPTPCYIQSISVTFETDEDAALNVLPRPLELRQPATAIVNVLHIERSTIGTFHETSMYLNALWMGEPCRYVVTMLVTNDQALCLGRELLGSPKKLGNVNLERHPEALFGYAERPAGNRVVSVAVSLEAPVDLSSAKPVPLEGAVSLRIIGHPEGSNAEPRVSMELIESKTPWETLEQWIGRGSVNFHAVHGPDSWNILPVKHIVGGVFGRYNVVIPQPRLLAEM